MAYLENDTARNVCFYERYGFEVVGRDEVLGIECTFTSRKPTDLQSSPLTNDSTVYPELWRGTYRLGRGPRSGLLSRLREPLH